MKHPPAREPYDLVIIIRVNAFGGSERHTIGLVNHLTAAGWRVALVQSGMDLVRRGLRPVPGKLDVVRTQLSLRELSRGDGRAWRALLEGLPAARALLVKTWYLAADIRLLRVLRSSYPNVYHIEHSLPPERAPLRSRLHLGIFPGLGLWWYRDSWLRWRMSRLADRVLAVSEGARRALLRDAMMDEDRVVACPNGVDLQDWVRDGGEGREFRRVHGIDAGVYLFGFVGRLVPLKGGDLLIEAFARLAQRGRDDVGLCVVGDGPCRGELEGLARRLGVADRVHFVGALHEVRPAYSAMDTLVCPSTTESFPLVLMEAMACGCRVIASDVGGVPEVVCDPACGDLLDVRDPGRWAAAMGRHARTPPGERPRLSREIRAVVARVHDGKARLGFVEEVLRGRTAVGCPG